MSRKDCPIMSLPDELLCYIFSFITDIPFKMKLEFVCKRFHLISSTKSSSWLGNDTLAFNMNCKGPTAASPTIKFFADFCDNTNSYHLATSCGVRVFHINGYKIRSEKWAQAITQLLERTTIRKLCLHVDDTKHFFDQICSSVPISVIKNNPSRIKLKYIEFHRRPWFFEHMEYFSDSMFLWAVEKSHETLEKIVLVLEECDSPISEENFTAFCSAIKKCTKLKSFAIKPPYRTPFIGMINALEGKPLTDLTIAGDICGLESKNKNSHEKNEPMERSILALCAASSRGIKSLSVKTWFKRTLTNLTMFSNSLDDRSKQSLEEIYIHNANYKATINSYLSHLDQLPFLFPNLGHLQLDFPNAAEVEALLLDENLLLNTNFFNVCNRTLRVVISDIRVSDVNGFKERLIASCEENGINQVFGEGEEQSWVILTNGEGMIEVGKVHEVVLESSDSEEDEMDDYY